MSDQKFPVELIGGAVDGQRFKAPGTGTGERPPARIVFLNEGRELEYIARRSDGEHERAANGCYLYDFKGIRAAS